MYFGLLVPYISVFYLTDIEALTLPCILKIQLLNGSASPRSIFRCTRCRSRSGGAVSHCENYLDLCTEGWKVGRDEKQVEHKTGYPKKGGSGFWCLLVHNVTFIGPRHYEQELNSRHEALPI